MTGLIIRQIESMGLRVSIAFVGERLLDTVNYLETQSSAIRSGSKSYLLFHYNPSRLNSLFNLTNVKFEECDHSNQILHQPSISQNVSAFSPNCLFNHNRMAKVRQNSYANKAISLWLKEEC